MSVGEIDERNLKILQIKQIALDKDKFGVLTFDKAYPRLQEIRRIIVEIEESGKAEILSPEDINKIHSHKKQLLRFLNRIAAINPATDSSFNKDVRDSLERDIENFYNSASHDLRLPLLFLRNEIALQGADQQKIQEERRLLVEVRKQSEELLRELSAIKEEKKKIESGRGELAATKLAIHFEGEVKRYEEGARQWFWAGLVFYGLFLFGIFIFAFAYFTNITNFSWQQISLKFVFVGTFWFALTFIIRNYNVSSHLAAVNRHRAAVARTLEDFLASNPERKSEMLKAATEAMFKNAPIGYVRKAEKDSGSPLLEIINNIPGINKGE